MKTQNLVTMANQIGDYFESFPDRTEALDGIANHLKKFWEPRMRSAFLAYIDIEHGGTVKDIVLAAVAAHRKELEPLARS